MPASALALISTFQRNHVTLVRPGELRWWHYRVATTNGPGAALFPNA